MIHSQGAAGYGWTRTLSALRSFHRLLASGYAVEVNGAVEDAAGLDIAVEHVG